MPSVAVGTIFIECNHFGGVPAEIATFQRCELLRGPEILEQTDGTVGGMLDVLRADDVDVVPLLVATACPAGPLTADCYASLKTELLDQLSQSLPLDGVLLPLHGAAAAEGIVDLEGDLIAAVRDVVGLDVPIVVTLDLHAHVTEQMVSASDALLAWETYPHADSASTGRRGALLLLDILAGRCRPMMVLARVPLIVGAVYGNTEGAGPFADVMRFAKSHEQLPGVLSTSAFLVHPYLDCPDMGGGAVVITDNDLDLARRLASETAEMYWQRRRDLEPEFHTPVAAIAAGSDIPGGPVLLVETADCCGGGAAGDSVATLRALLESDPHHPAIAPVVDPAAAAICHAAGEGAEVTLQLGHQLDPQWGRPLEVTGIVETLTNGQFEYTGGIWGGRMGDMGPTAVVRIGHIQVLITSNPTYDWADEQYRSVGLDLEAAKFIVVKNPMNYRTGYAGVSRGALILDTPGPTPATVRNRDFQYLRRPYFPADVDIPDLKPTLSCHEFGERKQNSL